MHKVVNESNVFEEYTVWVDKKNITFNIYFQLFLDTNKGPIKDK